MTMKRRNKLKTHQEYVQEVSTKRQDIEVIGTYLGANIKILHRHTTCGTVWDIPPGKILRTNGCPVCAVKNNRLLQPKSQQTYLQDLAIKRPDIEVLGTYLGAYTKILHRSKICGHQWEVNPTSILTGNSCPVCAGNQKKTHDHYVEDLAIKRPEYTVLEPYAGALTKILHQHITCGYQWRIPPSNILRGQGCPVCSLSGYKTNRRGYFYYFPVEYNGIRVLKYGITNVVKQRMRDHGRKINFDLASVKTILFEDGQLALDLENTVKSRFGGLASLPIDGFKTEVIPLELFDEFVGIVEKP